MSEHPPLGTEPQRPSRLHRIRYSASCLGWRRALDELLNRRPYEAEHDGAFDRAHGTDTAGSVEPDQLGIDDDRTTTMAIRYLPSPQRVTNWMFDRIGVEPASFSFVDLGCGKGRVTLLAAERGFAAIAGIEISAQLAAIAEANVSRYRPAVPGLAAITIDNVDAREFEMPSGNLLIHLYHPFDPEITAAVLDRLTPRAGTDRIVVAYLTYTGSVPAVTEMFAGFPWLRRVRYEESIRGQYNWLFYES